LNLAIPSSEVSDRVKAVMSRILALAAPGALLLASSLHAQVVATAPETEAPQYSERWDFYGGAEYSHFNPSPGRGVEAINLLGWNGTATVWFSSAVGLEGSARGLYGDLVVPANNEGIPSNPPMTEHLFLFGPNVRILKHKNYAFGMHGLIGAAYGVFDSGFPAGTQPQDVDIYNDKLAVGLAAGGWADYNIGSNLAVRFISDWQPTHYGFPWQNEFAGSVGIVYKFGSRPSK
jgi:opacity protein-like surface antigen